MASTSLQGQTLGKYRVLEPLGRGGMARVYRAYHPQLDRYVAIKVLRSDLVEEEEFLTRFHREARAVAALRHPNIVQVYDFDVQDEIYYMVMELLGGDTLKVRLSDYRLRDENVPWGETIRILLDVLNGLAYAHSEDMIHRDLKPANILLTRRGQAVIADFGIAQIIGGTRHTASGALMGTLNYMAPEQGLEGSCDARSDIYSLGIVLYEMLTRRTPFDADTPLAILLKHLNEPLPLPHKVNPDIPQPLERVVLKALAKEPDDRFQIAEEMSQALRQAAEAAEIELPDHISQPLSFTTQEAPSESVAIFSGTARQKITDSDFAADDTDATLGERLKAEQSPLNRVTSGAAATAPNDEFTEVSKEILDSLGALGRLGLDKLVGSLRESIGLKRGETSASPSELETVSASASVEVATGDEERNRRRRVTRSILSTIWILIITNLLFVWLGAILGWRIFEKGWPVELFLVGLGLCMVMTVSESIWVLIPTGIILGNGVLFAYYSLTGFWNHWVFLWPLEPLLIVGTVWLTIWLADREQLSRQVSRLLGWILGMMAAAWCFIVPLVSLIVPRFR
jgi:serine/threonine protein kinase